MIRWLQRHFWNLNPAVVSWHLKGSSGHLEVVAEMFIMFGLYYLCKKRKKPTTSTQMNQSEQLLAGFWYSGWWLWLKYSLLRFLMQYSLLHSNSIKHKYGSSTSQPTQYRLCYEKNLLDLCHLQGKSQKAGWSVE